MVTGDGRASIASGGVLMLVCCCCCRFTFQITTVALAALIDKAAD